MSGKSVGYKSIFPSCYTYLMSFNEKYSKICSLVKSDISKLEEKLTGSINLSPSIDEVLRIFLTKNSKRIRPVVSFLYLRACGITPDEKQYAFQTVIEIIHNASLIHDDVIDESDLRRGNLSLNKKFNNKTAILTGDYLLSAALRILNCLDTPETISLCVETLEGMCQGEVNQYFNKFKIPTLEQYLKKTEQKTAKLFQTALKGSMLLAGITDLNKAEKFSHALGMAFQIRDDILNLTRRDSLKPSQNDIGEGIDNAPVIFAGTTSNLNEGIAKTMTLLNNYVNEASDALNKLEESSYKLALEELLGILKDV